jgi:hypothetical protein
VREATTCQIIFKIKLLTRRGRVVQSMRKLSLPYLDFWQLLQEVEVHRVVHDKHVDSVRDRQ